MSVPPERIQPGRCYLLHAGRMGRVRRVIDIRSDGTVQFAVRRDVQPRPVWIPAMQTLRSFAKAVEREASCDVSPEGDE